MSNRRLFCLDWLRVSVVLLVIPHHVALTYSHVGKGYIYTEKPVNFIYYLIQSDFLNLWFMSLLFFVSGFSIFYSLKKRDIKSFLLERVKKLLLPTIFVLLLLGPLSAWYVQIVHLGNRIQFIGFYSEYLSSISEYLGWAQMWYCVYLFTFTLVLLPLFHYLLKYKSIVDRVNEFLIEGYNLFIPMVLLIILELGLRPYFPGFQNLIGDWANFITYMVFVICGFLFSQSVNLRNKLRYFNKQFLMLATVSTLLYIVANRFLHLDSSSIRYIKFALRGIASYSIVISLFNFSWNHFNYSNRLLNFLSRSSFGLYIFHYLIITIFNTIFIPMDVSHVIKYWGVIFLTYLTYFTSYSVVDRLRFIYVKKRSVYSFK